MAKKAFIHLGLCFAFMAASAMILIVLNIKDKGIY